MISNKLKIEPAILRHPVMSGNLRNLLDDGLPTAISIPEDELQQFQFDVPADEWGLEVYTHPWGIRTLTIVAPRDGNQDVAYHAEYWPVPERDRSRLSRYDWNDAEPSPNPGLMAYYVSERITAVSIPMMTKEGVRHNFYRHLFFEINDAPAWLKPAHSHNDPGIRLQDERQLVEEVRQMIR